MAAALADFLKLFIIAHLIGPFPFRQIFTDFGKQVEAVFPQKKAVDMFRMIFTQGADGVKAANGKFIGKFIMHRSSIL
jgi:hypothetical protein